ncbi:MAG: hypothetical protein ACI9DJ_000338 [Algoriphagus sp.]
MAKQVLNLKNTALLLFIFSLVPGDTFYGDLGLTQSLFLAPLLFVYLVSGKYLPANKILRNTGFIFAFVLTIHLGVSMFSGLVEWYRTIGGLILAFMVVTLCSRNENNRNQIKWLALAGSIPIIAFYLGFWEQAEGLVRMTFLKHDPNHLGHLIIYAFIALLAVIQVSQKIKKVWVWPVVAICFIPLAFTFSRTSLLAFIVVLVFYFIVLAGNRRAGNIVIGFFALLVGVIVLLSSQNRIVEGFADRFSEKNETRSNFNESGLEIIADNFFTGVGVAKFQDPNWRVANGFSRTKFDNQGGVSQVATSTHNGFLDVFLIGGAFMFGAFLTLITFPAIFLFRKSRFFEANIELQWRKFLVYTFTTTFMLINITYSLYNSKLGWWGIAFSYVLITPYYSAYLNKFKHKPPVYRLTENTSMAGVRPE